MSLMYTEGYVQLVEITHAQIKVPKNTFKITFIPQHNKAELRIYENNPYNTDYSFQICNYPINIEIDSNKEYYIDYVGENTSVLAVYYSL